MTDATVKVVEHGEASLLPDTNWTWRRLLIFEVCTSVILMMIYVLMARVAVPPSSSLFIRYGFYTLWLALTLYGVGATVTDVAKLASAVRTTRRETISKGQAPTTVTPERVEAGEAGELPPEQRVRR